MKKHPLALTVAAALVCGYLPAAVAQNAPAKGNDKVPLGSPEFYPSPLRPVGWRGDGTGHFPGATPPTTWSRGVNGERKIDSGNVLITIWAVVLIIPLAFLFGIVIAASRGHAGVRVALLTVMIIIFVLVMAASGVVL